VALIAATATGCVISVDSQTQVVRDEKRFTVEGVPDVHLTTHDGAIEIQSWDKPDVLVEIEKRGPTQEAIEALQIVTSQDGRRIELEVKRPRSESFGIGLNRSASASLRVTLPRRADITARSGDGSIRLDRVDGRIEVRTGDGAIRAADVTGELRMFTGDGSVAVQGAEGNLEVETGDGGVEVAGRLGRVRLHTGDGSIVYRAEAESAMTGDWEVTTGDGGVTLYLPEQFNADLDAHTGDGSIRTDLDLERQDTERDGERERRTLKGRLGDGGRMLRVRTGDGAIRIRRS
jgi:DUF4097 and DUF4098 domain-containing protein YvlB